MKQYGAALSVLIALCAFTVPAFSQEEQSTTKDMTPRKEKKAYQHVLAVGVDHHFSNGSNKLSPQVAYYWFGENFENPDLYMQFTFTTTHISLITAYKTDRIFTGVKPMVQHSTFAAWRSYTRGYEDDRRSIGGNHVGMQAFFQYYFARIFSAKVTFLPTYHLYKLPILTPNENRYATIPNNHWQLTPGIELILSDVEEKSLNRVRHGYEIKAMYQFAHRVGYGTWYDYDRLVFRGFPYHDQSREPFLGGIVYRSDVVNTNRLYFSAGGYYNFKKDFNLLVDVNGGFFTGVDRNNAEQIGYVEAENAIIPGYFNSEFYHHFYLIGRVQFGIPIPFWDTRIQPGYNVLYMPTHNNVIGQGRGAVWRGWLVRGYPRRIYTSVSCTFSTLLGNLLPMFIDYGYGIDAQRAKSSYDVYWRRWKRGSHELRVLFVMAFGKN